MLHCRRTPILLPILAWVALAAWSTSPVLADPPPAPSTDAPTSAESPVFVEAPFFVEAAEAVGIDFVHWNGRVGDRLMAEHTGGGGALFDYDRDGDLDLYLVQGHLLHTEKPGQGADGEARKSISPPPEGPLRDRLYRNERIRVEDGKKKEGELRFVDVTEASGLDARGYGMGAAVGDIDNDGWPDLYVTNFGPNQLWRNEGDGTFEDVTERWGAGDGRWTVSAAFVDLDADGWLDLYVGNYLELDLRRAEPCFATSGAPDYCGPSSYPPELDRLLINDRGRRFVDRTRESGVASEKGPALGVVSGDFDGDGRLDLYVANDETPNLLWLNTGTGEDGTPKLENMALLGGCAVNGEGLAESSMGLDAGDVDGDGDEDLFMVHLGQQTNTLYLNDGTAFFDDASEASGLGMPSWPYTGFGTKLVDLDNDGRLDVLVVNGAVKTVEALARAGDPFPLGQPDQLFLATEAEPGPGGSVPRFVDATARAGDALAGRTVSRGLAFGDLDNDGDTDAVAFDNNARPRVLINRVGQDRAWIGLEPWDGSLEREALGARLEIRTSGSLGTLHRRVRSEGSYATANDPRVLVGLGEAEKVDAVVVHWPGGPAERFEGLALRRYHRLVKGEGRPVDPGAASGGED